MVFYIDDDNEVRLSILYGLSATSSFLLILVNSYINDKEHKILENKILEIEKEIKKRSDFNHKIDPIKPYIKNDKIPSKMTAGSVSDNNVKGPLKLRFRRRNHGFRGYRNKRLGRKSSFPLMCLVAILSLAKN
uniref:Uncharacterized protein n=1 Tax=Mimivirus LCMiAC02 TaxID=2506609 RepID=A0A481Z267_9VIRU|nr:MAG: hypothetical protein LCMiAC02_02390 [Mimivirus LCMiAC02]